MKKWILIAILVIFLAIGWTGGHLYQSTLQSQKDFENQGLNIVKEKEIFSTIDNVDTYYGTNAYRIITGKNSKGEELIAWVPEEGEVITRKKSEGVSKEKALEGLYSTLKNLYDDKNRDPKEIHSIKLGMEDNTPIWEIIYIDNRSRLTYYRGLFETGQYWKFIRP